MDPRKKMLMEKKNERAVEVIKRLFQIIKANAIPYKEVAKELGIGTSILTMWKKGERFPSEKMLEKIELYINNNPITLPPVYEIMEKLQQYLIDTEKTLEETAAEIGTSHVNLVRWLAGQVIPERKSIEKLVKFLYK